MCGGQSDTRSQTSLMEAQTTSPQWYRGRGRSGKKGAELNRRAHRSRLQGAQQLSGYLQ
jgi:hypothetical protein